MRRHHAWLLGGLPAGVLLAAIWAARRNRATPAPQQPPDQAPTPPAPDERTTPTGQPPLPRSAGRQHRHRAAVAGASIVAGAGLVATIGITTGSPLLPAAIVGAVVVVGFCAFVVPRIIAPTRTPEDLAGVGDLTSKDRIQFADDRRRLQNEIRTGLLQGIGGAALLISLLFTWQQQQTTSKQVAHQLEVTRQGQMGERFSRAVEQLGSDKLDVRIGAIYELEQLAREAEERRAPIIEVLAAYVRQHAPRGVHVPPDNRELGVRAADVQVALTVLGRRPSGAGLVDLHQTNLSLAELFDADFGMANLTRADLSKAKLHGVDLSGADLAGADLREARLIGVMLTQANLDGANLSEVDLSEGYTPNFTSFPVVPLDLDEGMVPIVKTDLSWTSLTGANLAKANLNGVSLVLANMEEANLTGANLTSTDLNGANMSRANLTGADLRATDLTSTQLKDAYADSSTRWPSGFDWRKAGVRIST